MGHVVGKDIYKSLGEKIDNLAVRVELNKKFYDILKELYSHEEADVVVRMPYSLSPLEEIAKQTGYGKTRLLKILKGLCLKGLVVDMWLQEKYLYTPSPMVIGIFEFTMMRTGDDLGSKKWARLFYDYMHDGDFHKVNFQNGEKISPLRTLPHETTIKNEEFVEILDYEKATAIVEEADKFAIGICSCRHEKLHVDEKACDVPLETCLSFSFAADYLIRNKLAKEASRSEVLDNLARSKEMGVVFNADNVKNNITFICQCCGCCCNVLMGISKFGYTNTVVTSNFIASIDQETCTGCGKCVKVCPINAIDFLPIENPESRKKKEPKINTEICIGCGVCALSCSDTNSLKLISREKRVLHPETTFERNILQSLERGTLQNQLFGDPEKTSHKVIKGVVGGFLRLNPVKKALMSETLRSSFLETMKKGAVKQGKEWVTEL